MKEAIHQELQKIFQTLGIEAECTVEVPPSQTGAHYATNAALVAAKKTGKKLPLVAREIGEALEKAAIPGIEKIELTNPGFINFFLSREYFSKTIEEILTQKDKWGGNNINLGKTILIEYTSPNLFKPLHVGNLMSNVLGESISRLLQYSGATVVRANYPSDIGLTVAKGVWGLWRNHLDPHKIEELGQAYVLGSAAYEEDPTAKHEIDAINAKLYSNSNKEFNELRKHGIETSLKHLKDLCQTLGTTFDIEIFESEAAPIGVDLVRKNTDVFEQSDGALVYRGETEGLHTRVFLNSQGLPTYEAKELGNFELKKEKRPFDLAITITSVEQIDYFKVIIAAAVRVFPDLKNKLLHIAHGFLILPTGKMSSRKGNVISGESLIEDTRAKAREKMFDRQLPNREEIATEVAVAAIKYGILKQNIGKNIVFDQEKSLSFEGDSGPYLQYAHTRCVSILKKAAEVHKEKSLKHAPEQITEVEGLLVHFPEVVERAIVEYEPHHVAQYLSELSSTFNSWYGKERIIEDTPESTYKIAIVDAVRQTLFNGLWLLGCQAPEEM